MTPGAPRAPAPPRKLINTLKRKPGAKLKYKGLNLGSYFCPGHCTYPFLYRLAYARFPLPNIHKALTRHLGR